MKTFFQISFLFLVLQLVISCGTAKSLHHKPQLEGCNATIPVVEKNSNTFQRLTICYHPKQNKSYFEISWNGTIENSIWM